MLLTRAGNLARLGTRYGSSLVVGLRERRLYDQVETYCMFVGYPRSGHTLVGSLLDAHPEAVIAHELDVLRYLRVGFRGRQVFALILADAAREAERGRASGSYRYLVADQWNGRYRHLKVIGDQAGHRSTRRLMAKPDLLDALRLQVGVRVRVVHVIRNPFDTISTIAAQPRRASLEEAIDAYFTLCQGVQLVRARMDPAALLDIRLESLIADPPAALASLCGFLDLPADDGYVRDCARLVFPAPRQTRTHASWTPELVDDVRRRMEAFAFLSGYSFEG